MLSDIATEKKTTNIWAHRPPPTLQGATAAAVCLKILCSFEVQNQTGGNNISPLWKHLTSQQNKELSPSQDINKTVFLFCPSPPSPTAFYFLHFVRKGKSLHLNAIYLQAIYYLHMAMTAAVNAVDLSGRMRKSCPHSIAECGQQSPKQVPNAHGPLGFSPQPNNIVIAELLAVSGYLPCVLLPLLLHCRKQAQRDVLIITVIHLSGALLGSFFRSMTLNQEMFCAWSVWASMINTWKRQRPTWLQG